MGYNWPISPSRSVLDWSPVETYGIVLYEIDEEEKTMVRQLIFCVLAFAGTMGTSNADPFHLFHPRPVFAQPVVGYGPVVAYQPAYVVPVATYAVSHVPVTTVTYSTGYYAPMVPMVAAAPVLYSPPVYPVSVYAAPVYAAPVYYGRSLHSHLNVRRNGSYNYHLRVR